MGIGMLFYLLVGMMLATTSYNIYSLVPLAVIVVLIIAAAGLTKGTDIFAFLGVGAVLGMSRGVGAGKAGRGFTVAKARARVKGQVSKRSLGSLGGIVGKLAGKGIKAAAGKVMGGGKGVQKGAEAAKGKLAGSAVAAGAREAASKATTSKVLIGAAGVAAVAGISTRVAGGQPSKRTAEQRKGTGVGRLREYRLTSQMKKTEKASTAADRARARLAAAGGPTRAGIRSWLNNRGLDKDGNLKATRYTVMPFLHLPVPGLSAIPGLNRIVRGPEARLQIQEAKLQTQVNLALNSLNKSGYLGMAPPPIPKNTVMQLEGKGGTPPAVAPQSAGGQQLSPPPIPQAAVKHNLTYMDRLQWTSDNFGGGVAGIVAAPLMVGMFAAAAVKRGGAFELRETGTDAQGNRTVQWVDTRAPEDKMHFWRDVSEWRRQQESFKAGYEGRTYDGGSSWRPERESDGYGSRDWARSGFTYAPGGVGGGAESAMTGRGILSRVVEGGASFAGHAYKPAGEWAERRFGEPAGEAHEYTYSKNSGVDALVGMTPSMTYEHARKLSENGVKTVGDMAGFDISTKEGRRGLEELSSRTGIGYNDLATMRYAASGIAKRAGEEEGRGGGGRNDEYRTVFQHANGANVEGAESDWRHKDVQREAEIRIQATPEEKKEETEEEIRKKAEAEKNAKKHGEAPPE